MSRSIEVSQRRWGFGAIISVGDQVGRRCVVMRVWAVLVGGCKSLVKGGELGSKESAVEVGATKWIRGSAQVERLGPLAEWQLGFPGLEIRH